MASPQQRSKRSQPPLVYCSIRHSGLTVTKLATEALGFRFSTLPVDLPRAHLVLGLHEHDMHEVWQSLRNAAWVGRLFGADSATDKGTNEELGFLARALDPVTFSECVPETWVLPQCASMLQGAMAASPLQPFILKPRNSSEGNGIRLLLNFEDVGNVVDAVVQRYVAAPLLLGGLKFDLRMYVLVKQLQPLELWLFREGLARFCTEEYQAPTRKNRHQVTAHLTNYSLNKRAPNFLHSDDPHGANGSKRSLSSTIPLILEALPDLDENELWSRLSKATLRGIIPLVPFLIDAERQQRQQTKRGNESDGPHFSQLFGVDLLLDAQGAAWLLEVNSFPSLSIDSTVPFTGEGKCCRCMHDYKPHIHVQSAIDCHVKLAVVRGTIQLLAEHQSADEEPGASARDNNVTATTSLHADSSFMPLLPDAAELATAEALCTLAEVFGKCCKGGAAIADPFRLRKLFMAIGEDGREVDLQLRRLAQQADGLKFVPVAGLLLERLHASRPDTPLKDFLAATLHEAWDAV